jgi:hypothetical protein
VAPEFGCHRQRKPGCDEHEPLADHCGS